MAETSVPAPLLTFLSRYSRYLLVSHKEPDGDSLASSLALQSFLNRKGKTCLLYTPGPFVRREIADMQAEFKTKIDPSEIQKPDTAVVVLDCSTLERIAGMADVLRGLPTAVIDHHAAGSPFGDVRFIDTKAPSTSYLIQLIIEHEDRLQQKEAELILFAVATDTGFFRHLDTDSAETFAAAARLTAAGASPKLVYDRIYGDYTLEARRLLGLLLHRTEPFFNGSLLITCEYRPDTEEFGIGSRDSDTLYKLLFGTSRCKAIVLIREEEDCRSVSLRSIGDIDVSAIAKHHGGGGHVHAAGFESRKSVKELKNEIKQSFSAVIKNHG